MNSDITGNTDQNAVPKPRGGQPAQGQEGRLRDTASSMLVSGDETISAQRRLEKSLIGT